MLLDNIHRLVCVLKTQRFGDWTPEIGASSVDWTQQSRFLPEDGDRVQPPKRCVFKTETRRWILSKSIMVVLMYHRHKLLDLI
jgi:hypothetical protein